VAQKPESRGLFARIVARLQRVRATFAMSSASASTQKRLTSAPVRRLLVICHGNIYRSAFVGAYLKTNLDSSVEVRSAGFHPVEGRPAPERHVAMSEKVGVSLRDHRSCIVKREDIDWADAIVLMDRKNWVQLRGVDAPADKLIWLGALDPQGPIEVLDPYSMDEAAAEKVVARLRRCSELLADAVRRANSPKGL
jgi:protein-tyrosine-phosphatase